MMIIKMMKMKMILLHLSNHKNYDYFQCVRGQNHDGIYNFLNRCGGLFFSKCISSV